MKKELKYLPKFWEYMKTIEPTYENVDKIGKALETTYDDGFHYQMIDDHKPIAEMMDDMLVYTDITTSIFIRMVQDAKVDNENELMLWTDINGDYHIRDYQHFIEELADGSFLIFDEPTILTLIENIGI